MLSDEDALRIINLPSPPNLSPEILMTQFEIDNTKDNFLNFIICIASYHLRYLYCNSEVD
jgi:hypothetical protein